jgi:CDP-2,3-bis-(O-geranylgeranyl)-sn-glycerol synthase
VKIFLEALLLFLPAGVANSTPPLLTRFLGAGRPIDGGRSWRSLPLLGAHKTWQGLIGGTLAGFLTFVVQRRIDHLQIPLIAGVAMSFGALAGDLVKSFVKRRFAVEPGRAWFPLDQLDYVFGALLASAPFIPLSPALIGATIAVYFALHLVVSAIGFAVGVKDSPL